MQLVRLIRDHDVGHKPLLRRRPGIRPPMARLLVLRAWNAHASARFNVGPGTPIPLRVSAQSLGPYGTNCFIVSSAGTGEALVVDPGAEPDRIRRSLQASGLRCAAILVTHAHHDHIGAVGPLARDGSTPVYASRGEASILSAPSTGLDSGLGPIEPHDPEVLLDGGERFALAGLDVEVLAVPGHSPAALAFRITDPADGDEQVFVGDVIFAGSVGRTDFPADRPGPCWSGRSSRCTTRVRARTCRSTPATGRRRRSAASAAPTRSSTPSEHVERRVPDAPRHARLAAGADARRAGTWSTARARSSSARATARWPRRCSRTPASSRAPAARAPRSCRRRCTPSRTSSERPLSLRPGAHRLARARLPRSTACRASRSPSSLVPSAPATATTRCRSGRLREFHQFDVEAIGSVDPAVDAELIALQAAWYDALGLRGLELRAELRSATPATAARYLEAARGVPRRRTAPSSPPTCGAQRDTNPLRAFDTKDERSRTIMAEAPKITDHLSPAAQEHFEAVRALLDARGVRLPGRAGARARARLLHAHRVGVQVAGRSAPSRRSRGGGRYDGLAEADRRPADAGRGLRLRRRAPACSPSARPRRRRAAAGPTLFFAILHPPAPPAPAGAARRGPGRTGCACELDLAGRGLKGQFKHADRLGARVQRGRGQDEWERGVARLRDGCPPARRLEVPLDACAHGRSRKGSVT